MGPYFSPINSPWAINLLPHRLLLVAHGILIKPHGLGNLLFLAIDSACFLRLAIRITPQPLYLQLHPLISHHKLFLLCRLKISSFHT